MPGGHRLLVRVCRSFRVHFDFWQLEFTFLLVVVEKAIIRTYKSGRVFLDFQMYDCWVCRFYCNCIMLYDYCTHISNQDQHARRKNGLRCLNGCCDWGPGRSLSAHTHMTSMHTQPTEHLHMHMTYVQIQPFQTDWNTRGQEILAIAKLLNAEHILWKLLHFVGL